MASAVGDSRSQKKKKELEARDARIEETFIRASMSHPDGRRFLWNLLSSCQVFVEGDSLDHATLAYNKGRRNVGLTLLSKILRYAGREYVLMTEESTRISLLIPDDEEVESDD